MWREDPDEENHPYERVAWRNTDGKDHAGVVTFHPEGIKDKLGGAERRVKGDLERFKELIESHGRESGAWRGEVPRDASGRPRRPEHAAG